MQTPQPQIIYHHDKPAYAVFAWKDYEKLMKLLANTSSTTSSAVSLENPIKVARVKAGKTQVELAEALGVKQSYIAKIEGRSYQPTHQLLARVVKALMR